VPFDETGSFVGNKEKHCDRDDPDDDPCGAPWDPVALDPEHRRVVSGVPGRRTPEHTPLLVADFFQRTEGRLMNVMTSDENPADAAALVDVYGEAIPPARPGRPGRPPSPSKVPPQRLPYATVHKIRENNRGVQVETRVVYGTPRGVAKALEASAVNPSVNTVFVERPNGTDRNRNARKVRKPYCFSKGGEVHEAVTSFPMYSYTCCWPGGTLRQRAAAGKWEQRTPAMAAGLADHTWSIAEWLRFPAAVQC
jgi:hypothetical protein